MCGGGDSVSRNCVDTSKHYVVTFHPIFSFLQEYVFTDKGRHTVRVTVRSDLGSLKDDLEVVSTWL